MTLQAQFEQAQADSKNLPERPDNMTLLKIYALFNKPAAATPKASVPASPTWSAAPSGMPGMPPRGHLKRTRCSNTSI